MGFGSVLSSVGAMGGAIKAFIAAGMSAKVIKLVSDNTAAIAGACRALTAEENVREAIGDLLKYTATQSRHYLARAVARLTIALQIDDELAEIVAAQKEVEAEKSRPESIVEVAEDVVADGDVIVKKGDKLALLEDGGALVLPKDFKLQDAGPDAGRPAN